MHVEKINYYSFSFFSSIFLVTGFLNSKINELLQSQNVWRVGVKKDKKTGELVGNKKSKQDTLLCHSNNLIKWVLAKKLFAGSMASATMIMMLAHTPVSRKVFQFFHCNEIGGRFYLRADYTIRCWSLNWYAFSPLVLVMLCVFTLGLPGVISMYLWKNKHHLYSTKVQQNMGWLMDPYHRGAEFWSIHDVILKMILTGALIYIPESARAAVALMVGVCVVATLNYFQPHKSNLLFWLNQISFVATTFKYAAALMLRVDHSKYNDGSERMLGWLLIGLDLSFLVGSVICLVLAFVAMRRKIHRHVNIKQRMRMFARTASTMDTFDSNGRTKVTPIGSKKETNEENLRIKKRADEDLRIWDGSEKEGGDDSARQELREIKTKFGATSEEYKAALDEMGARLGGDEAAAEWEDEDSHTEIRL